MLADSGALRGQGDDVSERNSREKWTQDLQGTGGHVSCGAATEPYYSFAV